MSPPRRRLDGRLLRRLAAAVAVVAVATSAAATYGAGRTDRKPPTQPGNLQATIVGSNAVSLTWHASKDNGNLVSYAVSVDGQRIGTTSATTFVATALACARTYAFEVRAFDRRGNYSTPARVTATTGACPDVEAPSAPTGVVQLERTASSITIAWSASTDNVGVVAYDLYRDGQLVGETAQRSYIFGSLACARTYTLSVAARDAAGHVSGRATVLMSTADCPDTTPPSTPTGLAQTAASATSVTLAWNASSDNNRVAAYDVFRDGQVIGSTAETSYRIDGLSCGTSYTVGVAARDAAGNRSAPATVLAAAAPCTTPDTTPPSVPQNRRVQAGATSLTMTWSPSTDNVGVTGYNVYLDGAAVATTTQTSYTYTGLQCGRTYVVALEARDLAGNVSDRAAATAQASTLACAGDTTPPSVPGQVSVSAATPTSVTLAWSAASDNVGVAGYGVYRDGARIADLASSARSHVVTGLACGSSASLAVDAADAAGNRSAPVQVVAATAPCPDTQPPSTPGGLSATGSTETSVSIRWNVSTDNVGVTGYGVYVGGVRVAETASASYVAQSLACGRSYTVAVDARDAAGNRSAQTSLVVSTTTCPAEPPPGTVPVYTSANPPATPTVDQLPRRSSVSKDGVTWTFSQAVPVGRFINGDYYVVGPVTVTSISPVPANGRNGSVKNLPARDGITGFDSRTQGNRYDASIRANPPVSLAPGDSLVSSISVDTVGATRRVLFDTATGSPVKSISILTSVSAPQPPDAFRPSYTGRGAPIFRSRNLRRELLPRLAAVSSTPTLAQFEGYFRRPWIDNLFFNFDSPIEYMPDYSREIARAVGMAGLLLTLDYSAEAKEPLLVYLTQYGIDLAGLVEAGHRGWPAFGGHGSGRKFPIVLAGTLLGEPSLQSPPGRYGEDEQTMSGQGWTGATALYAGHYGESGTGEYGPYEHLRPRDWPSLMGEDYRRCCTSSAWIGEALASMLIEGVDDAWNSSAFFAYADRWMTEDDTQHIATIRAERGKDYSAFPQREAWDDFVTNMWRAYRNGAGGGGGDRSPPSTPTSLRVTGTTGSSVTVAWNASTDNVGVTGYGLYVDGRQTGSSSTTAATLGGLACGRTYTIGVDARDAAGNRSGTAVVAAVTATCPGDSTPPSPPSGLAQTAATETSVSISWNAATDNVGVTGYGLYRDGASAGSTPASTRTHTFSGLACGSSYVLAVDATDAAGNRSAKASLAGTTAACPTGGGTAASVFLAPAGSDTNPCTKAAPCKTFDRGFRIAQPGQVVELAGGTYAGGHTIPNVTKSATADVVFAPAPGATVTLDGGMSVYGKHVEIRGVSLKGSFYVKCGADDVTFRDSKAGLFFIRPATNISFVNVEFGPSRTISQIGTTADCRWSPDRILMDSVYMHDFWWSGSVQSTVHMECLTIEAANNFTLRNSKFHRCEDFDILIKHYATVLKSTNMTFENNWFDKPWPDGTSAIQFSEPASGGTYENVLFRNNSFAATLQIKPEVSYVNMRLIANIGTRRGGDCSSATGGYNIWSGTAPCSSTDRQAPTGYVDQAGFDFHLAPGAAAIDRGDPASYPARDIDGEARPRGGVPDAGADERQ